VVAQRLNVQVDGFVDEGADFVESIAAGDAAGEVRDVGGEASVRGRFDDNDVFHDNLTSGRWPRGFVFRHLGPRSPHRATASITCSTEISPTHIGGRHLILG
jgi:hypothetical protein